MMLLADIEDREIPGVLAKIVAANLEARIKPSNCFKRWEELLSQIRGSAYPVGPQP